MSTRTAGPVAARLDAGGRVDDPAGTVTAAGASRLSARRRILKVPHESHLSDGLCWLEHARSSGPVPGARRVVPAAHPEHSSYLVPACALELAAAAAFGESVDATGEVLDEVAIARVLDGHRLRLTRAEETELLRRMMAAGWTDEDAAAHLGVSKRTVLRRRSEALIPSSRQRLSPTPTTRRSA